MSYKPAVLTFNQKFIIRTEHAVVVFRETGLQKLDKFPLISGIYITENKPADVSGLKVCI